MQSDDEAMICNYKNKKIQIYDLCKYNTNKMRKIDNLVHYDGQWMTGADRLARRVYKSGNRRNVVARRENGRLTGFYVINDEGETSLIEIR